MERAADGSFAVALTAIGGMFTGTADLTEACIG